MKLPSDVALIAHRGASAYAPENTRSSYLKARELGGKILETDMRLTKDGEVVLCHDNDLQRYIGRKVRAEDLTAAEIKELDAGAWFSQDFAAEKFYFLADMLDDFGADCAFDLEIKGEDPSLPAAAAELVQSRGLISKTCFISFSIEQLARVRAVSPDVRLGFLQSRFQVNDALKRCQELGIAELGLHFDQCSLRTTFQAKRYVAAVRAWGFPRERERLLPVAESCVAAGCIALAVDNLDYFSY